MTKAIQTTLKDEDLLTKLSQIAEARYRVGKGVQQDVLRSQVEISLLLQRLTVLQQQRNTSQARLNTLLARSPEASLSPAENIERSPLNHSLDDLYRLARQSDPGLHREEQMIERNQLAANLAQKDYYPDLSVGYMYQQRQNWTGRQISSVTSYSEPSFTARPPILISGMEAIGHEA